MFRSYIEYHENKGIGGWLWLLLLSLVSNIFGFLVYTYLGFFNVVYTGWRGLVFFAPPIIGLLLSCYTLYLMITYKNKFKVFTFFLFAYSSLFYISVGILIDVKSIAIDGYKIAFYSIIWALYLLLSKRVEYTFIN